MNGKGATLETNVKAIELKDLWRKYKSSGSDRAREQLVVAYSPLVKYVAGRMSSGLPAHVEEADLISYGLIGLINAIERFDIDREIKFETYADQGRDHRRAARPGLGASLRPRPGA
jgi:RNA polymerase sigma factor FliA